MNAERAEIDAMIAYARTMPGGKWHARIVFTDSWKVEWQVGERKIQVRPVLARQLVRDIRKRFTDALRKVPEEKRGEQRANDVFAFCDGMDQKAKDALFKNWEAA